MYQAPADTTSDDTAVHSSILSGSDGNIAPKNRRTTTTDVTPSVAVCRRLQFDADDDIDASDGRKTSRDSVLDYLERLYDDKVEQWNMDFRAVRPTSGGRWQWTRVYADRPANDDDDHCSTVSRVIMTKKRRARRINGKRRVVHIDTVFSSFQLISLAYCI